MKVNVNKDGYLEFYKIKDADIEVEISDEEYEKIKLGTPFGYLWRLVDNIFILEPQLDIENLKALRETECFRIIDRSKLWYDSLTKEQYTELQTWYKAWLDVTKTKVIPEKPEWLK